MAWLEARSSTRRDGEAAGAVRSSPRRAPGTDAFVAIEEAAFVYEVGENDDEELGAEVVLAKRPIIDFLGVCRRDEDARARSPMPDHYPSMCRQGRVRALACGRAPRPSQVRQRMHWTKMAPSVLFACGTSRSCSRRCLSAETSSLHMSWPKTIS